MATAATLLIVLSPFFLVIATLIKLTSSGPVFYRQTRLGRDCEDFDLLKFRSMVDGADRMLEQVGHLNQASGPLFKADKDPRVTVIGRILRRTFADELPQLINVLRGDMSLVGPRPCLPGETAAMEQQVIFRFAVPQGITGPWQTSGYHSLSFEKRLQIERDYVAGWSFWRDFVILLRTVPLVLSRAGK